MKSPLDSGGAEVSNKLMNIAVIGAGSVGGSLGAGWARAGHKVVYGVRHPESDKTRKALETSPGAAADAVAGAVKGADVVVLATPWGDTTRAALEACGDLEGKPLLDCTNPIGPDFELTHGKDDSGGEQVQRWAPSAHVVKIFNTTGFKNMQDPAYGEDAASMFYCGDDATAKGVAKQLSDELGFESLDVGPLTQARYLEPLAMLWITMALNHGYGLNIAFKLLRR